MKKSVLLGTVVCFAIGFATACSDDEGGEDSESTGGSGATGGSGGGVTGGSSGAATGGSSGATTGGSSGATTGGSGGATTGGSGGTATGGSAGSASGGQSGSSGSGGSGGVGGTGGSGGSAGGASLNCTETATGCLCAPISPQPDDVPICSRQSVNGICCASSVTGFCSCRTWTCENDSLGCTCGAGSDGSLSACSGDYGVCCLSVTGTASSCYCDDLLTECVGSNDMEVENCEIDIAPCGPGEEAVDTCKG